MIKLRLFSFVKIIYMNEQIKGLIRHVLTFVGGIAVAKGFFDESSINEVIGAVMTIIGTVWSVASKK
jgi:hypothetical protein